LPPILPGPALWGENKKNRCSQLAKHPRQLLYQLDPERQHASSRQLPSQLPYGAPPFFCRCCCRSTTDAAAAQQLPLLLPIPADASHAAAAAALPQTLLLLLLLLYRKRCCCCYPAIAEANQTAAARQLTLLPLNNCRCCCPSLQMQAMLLLMLPLLAWE
jgi:hypothetical protein